jgi:hypothetical protein
MLVDVEALGTSAVPKNWQCLTASPQLNRTTQQLLLRLPGVVSPIAVPRRPVHPGRAAPKSTPTMEVS